MAQNRNYPPITPSTYKVSLQADINFEFVSAFTIFPYKFGNTGSPYQTTAKYIQTVLINGEPIFSNEYTIFRIQFSETYRGENVGFSTVLKANDIIKVIYTLDVNFSNSSSPDFNNTVSYTFSVVENRLPLKPWTITGVINRTLDIAEPIRAGEKPRFRLNVEQAEQFDKILAPQFSFTKQTLRECLQEIGKVVHGEPRLEPKKDESGKYYFEVIYDIYASQEKSGIYTLPYIKETVSQLIDSYTSYLDSNAENLVNQLDKYQGVIVEPYRDGAKSVRTENLYVRIEDTNMIIPTQYPIYSVEKLEYVYTENGEVKSADITPWLFEKSIYDSQLSSYGEQYPYAKVYALYYSQGNKNIGGLNFKVSKSTDTATAYGNYSIINVLRQATGNEELTVNDYELMCFRVTYTPFYNARVAQTKPYYKEFLKPAALIFNQQSNVIESRYYGENLKGAVARLGNVDKSLTYIIYNIMLIPRAGQMFNKDYYISAVAIEVLPTCFVVTIGLSKDFNRLSAYIGVSSVKRFSEISQTQAVERNTLYREYIVIGTRDEPSADSLIGNNLLAMIADTFTQNGGFKPLSNVCAWGTSYQGNDVAGAVNLPVISSAFGNSISFSWQYEDNYSAGAISQYQNNNNVSGYFQSSQPYTDYYGRIYYYHFDIQPQGPTVNAANLTDIGRGLPKGEKVEVSSGYVSTVGQTPYILRKDNREALQVNFQIDFVTNLESIIIGSALASYCPAVRGSGNVNDGNNPLRARLYVFDTDLNKFTDHVEAYENVDLSKMQSAEVTVDVRDGYFIVNAGAYPTTESGADKGKSWAIITEQYSIETQVEDERGLESTQKTFYGGDLLIGQNIEVNSGEAFAPIYFTKKREIFDKSVWKDRR